MLRNDSTKILSHCFHNKNLMFPYEQKTLPVHHSKPLQFLTYNCLGIRYGFSSTHWHGVAWWCAQWKVERLCLAPSLQEVTECNKVGHCQKDPDLFCIWFWNSFWSLFIPKPWHNLHIHSMIPCRLWPSLSRRRGLKPHFSLTVAGLYSFY